MSNEDINKFCDAVWTAVQEATDLFNFAAGE